MDDLLYCTGEISRNTGIISKVGEETLIFMVPDVEKQGKKVEA